MRLVHDWRFNEVSHWVELAKLLEEAKFHGIFIADVLGNLTRVLELDVSADYCLQGDTMCTMNL